MKKLFKLLFVVFLIAITIFIFLFYKNKMVNPAGVDEIETSIGNASYSIEDTKTADIFSSPEDPASPTPQPEVDINADLPLPENFPTDVAVFPGARAFDIPNTGTNGLVVVNFVTDSPEDEVRAFYSSQLANDGWEIRSMEDGADSSFLGGLKEGRGVSLTFSEEDGGSTFMVSYRYSVAPTQ